jgi:DNA (cytosine-5)-methyltransferase 1
VTYAVLDAADGWAPQRRRRVFFVGFRDDKVSQGALERFAWPTAGDTGASPRVRSILEREEDAADPPGAAMRACEVSSYQMDRAARFFARAGAGGFARTKDASRERRTNAVAYVAADPDGHARTLCASYRRSSAYNAELVPPSAATRARRPRFYTAREAARLMGFPETFQPDPERAWHELGNSVVVPLVRDVAAAVLTAMRWGEAAEVPARDE